MIKTILDLDGNPYGLVDARIGDLFDKLDIIIDMRENIENVSGVFSPEYLAELEKTVAETTELANNFGANVEAINAAILAIEAAVEDVATNTGNIANVTLKANTNVTEIESAKVDIATNTLDIATNVTSILSNSTAITAIQNINLYDDTQMQTHLQRLASIKEIYVSQQGADESDGLVLSSAVRSLKHALTLVADGGVVNVGVGTFTEVCPMIVPRNVSIVGAGLRVTSVKPTAATNKLGTFKVDSGAYLTNMAFVDHQVGSFAVSFNELADNTAIGAIGLGAHIFKSPYIQNCTSYTAEDDAGLAGSTSDGTTGGGMLIDGDGCSSNTPIRSMVVDSYTQINLDGPGCLVTNNAYAQLVSFFGTFCSYHVKAENGGQVNLSNSTTDFGTLGLVASGKSPQPIYSGKGGATDAGENTLDITDMSQNTIGLSSRPAEGQIFVVGDETYTITGALEITDGYKVTFYPYLIKSVQDEEEVLFYQRSQISTSGHTMEYVGAGTNYLALPFNGGQSIPGNEIVQIGEGRVFYSTTDQLGTFRVGKQFSVNGTTGEVTISTDSFNLSGLNAIGPFSRDGGQTAVGSQLLEFSNNVELQSSTGAVDANTAPTQYAVAQYLFNHYIMKEDFADVATSGSYADLDNLPTLGTAAATNSTAYATAAQGGKADSAIQAGDLETVATSGDFNDLSNKPDPFDPSSLATVATSGSYNDLENKPAAGTDGSYATAAQGAKADSALQASDASTVATSGDFDDLSNKPDPFDPDSLGSAAQTDSTDYATAAQGNTADSAVQPSDLATVASSGSYDDLTDKPTVTNGEDGTDGANGSPIGAIILVSNGRILVESDANNMIISETNSSITLTIPNDSTYDFPIGSVVHITQDGTGQITVENQGDVTVRIRNGLSNKTAVRYSTCTAAKVGVNRWYLFGDLE